MGLLTDFENSKTPPKPKRKPCPIHKIIHTQTFSIMELEMMVRNAEIFSICLSCVASMEKRLQETWRKEIHDAAKRDMGGMAGKKGKRTGKR